MGAKDNSDRVRLRSTELRGPFILISEPKTDGYPLNVMTVAVIQSLFLGFSSYLVRWIIPEGYCIIQGLSYYLSSYKGGNMFMRSQKQTPSESVAETRFSSSDQSEAPVHAYLGKEVRFRGVIRFDGIARIDGRVEGEIQSKGTLQIGEPALILANIESDVIVTNGKIVGDIVARRKIHLLAPACVEGSIKAPLITMEDGVLVNGTIEMSTLSSKKTEGQAVDSQTQVVA